MRSWMVRIGAKRRAFATGREGRETATTTGRMSETGLVAAIVGIRTASGTAADIDAHRLLQQPCCSITSGVDVQQTDSVRIANASEAMIAVNRFTIITISSA